MRSVTDEVTPYERMVLATVRLTEAWVEFWASIEAYGQSKQVSSRQPSDGSSDHGARSQPE